MRSTMRQSRAYLFNAAICAVICAGVIMLSLLPAFAPGAHAAVAAVAMENYCVVPPYVKTNIDPNIYLVVDNSNINGSWAYGDETDESMANTYVGNTVAANGDRYDGLFDSELFYTYTGNNRFVPDNGGTEDPDCSAPVNSECGNIGVFDGNMLNFVTTSRYDLIMSILLGGTGTPQTTSNFLYSINGIWRDSSGTDRLLWPLKVYSYEGDTDGDGTADTTYQCLLEIDPLDKAKPLEITESGVYSCGLLMDPPVGPASDHSYATAALSVPVSPGPVMYAGAAGDNIPALTKEEREKMRKFIRTFTDNMLGILSPKDAWAGAPLKVNNPKNTTDASPYTADVQSGEYFTIALTTSGGGDPCDVHLPVEERTDKDYRCWTQPNPADSGFSSTWIAGSSTWAITGTPDVSQIDKPAYDFDVEASDGSGGIATAYFSITVVNTVVAAATGEFDINVCAGDYDLNCKNVGAGVDLKEGLLQDYWSRARFGLESFQAVDNPTNEKCVAESSDDTMDVTFGNKIKLATPVGSTTEFTYLVDGLYDAILMFMGENPAPVCDVFEADETKCRNNFILMLTSAEGADRVTDPSTKVFTPPSPDCDGAESYLAKNACYAYNTDLRSASVGAMPIINGVQKVSTYIVDAMSTNSANREILQEAAQLGGGNYYGAEDPGSLKEELKQAFEDIIKRAASGTAASVLASGEGSGANLIQAIYYPRRKFLDSEAGAYDEITWIGRLTNFWYFVDPYFANSNIREEIFDSVNETYPTLDLIDDPIIEMYFDTASEVVKADRWEDTDGDGEPDIDLEEDDPTFESLGNIWEAGMKLWNTPAGERVIYVADLVNSSIGTTDLIRFTNTTTFIQDADIQSALQASGDDEARSIVEYVMGFQTDQCDLDDIDYCRTRLVKVDVNGDGDTLDEEATPYAGASETYNETVAEVWKLGDVLNSTPRLVATLANHRYDDVYRDSTYKEYVESDVYQSRGLAIAGSNAGMLHAFRLGQLEYDWSDRNIWEHGRLLGTDLGREEWAFIPTDALPYLRYQMSPGYCHVYLVDLSSYILDLSPIDVSTGLPDPLATRTKDSWRTIVIAGMRFGGACEGASATCAQDKDMVSSNLVDGSPDGVKSNSMDGISNDCVKSPLDNIGFSSYFALDITDTDEPPKLLWEFTREDLSLAELATGGLGFTTTGPAIVRTAPYYTDGLGVLRRNGTANGYWNIVVGSGPTGPIDKDVSQFLGRSDQNLKFFVFDAWLGPDVASASFPSGLEVIDTGIAEAYASSMFNIPLDVQMNTGELQDYADDVMYIGYTKKCTATRTGDPECDAGLWNDGGIGRIVTYSKPTPADWEWSVLIDGIGPVTAATAKALDPRSDQIWVLAATGRYSYVKPDYSIDDHPSMPDDYESTRHIAGFLDPCFQDTTAGYKGAPGTPCTEAVAWTDLVDVTYDAAGADVNALDKKGWFIALDEAIPSEGYASERVITDLVATNTGVLFATSFKPYTDECSIGGKSHLWAVMLESGGATGTLLKGTVVMQVSTGSIEKIDLSEAFTQKGGRRSEMIEGKPPISQGMSIAQTPPPVDRVLHFIERDY